MALDDRADRHDGLIAIGGVARRAGDFPRVARIAWRDRLSVLDAPVVVKTLAVTLCTGVASLGLYTYLAEVAARRGYSGSTRAFIWAWGLGGMIGALLIGRLIDSYLPPRKATPLLLMVMAVAFMLLEWGPLRVAGVGCFLWGLAGWASVAPQQHALLSFAPRHTTAAIAWNSSVNYLGGAIGAALGSAMLSAHLSAQALVLGAISSVVIALLLHASKGRPAN